LLNFPEPLILTCKRKMTISSSQGWRKVKADTWWMYLIPLNWTLKVVKIVNFMWYIFYYNKNNNKLGAHGACL
jgi:hypothetical protein